MRVSGKIHYKQHNIEFDVRFSHEDIKEGSIESEEAKQELIDQINRKFRVKYPYASEIDPVHVSVL